jgi:hypothetical protein
MGAFNKDDVVLIRYGSNTNKPLVKVTVVGTYDVDRWYGNDSSGLEWVFAKEDVVMRETTINNQIVSPVHYTSHPSGIEPIQITKYETFLRGNIIKYVMRAPYKGKELQDLEKAQQYLEWEIERVKNDQQPKDDNGAGERS